MNISDDKAVKVGTKMFWWGITLLILLAIFKFADKAISREIRVYRESHAPKGFIEGDLWIARGSTVKKPGIKTKTRRREMAGGKDVEIVTPCEVMYPYITSLEPGENVQIRHIDFGPDFPTRNRCSYGANGASIPIYGEPGKVTRPRFRHDLPFPDLPPGVMVFIIQDARGNIVAHDYIREAGALSTLIIRSPKKPRCTCSITICRRSSPIPPRTNRSDGTDPPQRFMQRGSVRSPQQWRSRTTDLRDN